LNKFRGIQSPIGALRSLALPVLLGLVFGPLAVTLHESGHSVVAWSSGATFAMHSTSTSVQAGSGQLNMTWLLGAGPAVELTGATLGLIWLRHRRRSRSRSRADLGDWIATFLAGLSLRWLTRVPVGVVSGLRSGFVSVDEALLSEHLGLASWCLPALLVVPAALVFLSLVRLHAEGARLVPLVTFYVAQGLGVFAWTGLIAPLLLAG
jgi:hypothetical protein